VRCRWRDISFWLKASVALRGVACAVRLPRVACLRCDWVLSCVLGFCCSAIGIIRRRIWVRRFCRKATRGLEAGSRHMEPHRRTRPRAAATTRRRGSETFPHSAELILINHPNWYHHCRAIVLQYQVLHCNRPHLHYLPPPHTHTHCALTLRGSHGPQQAKPHRFESRPPTLHPASHTTLLDC
jgi:hypothetical protein